MRELLTILIIRIKLTQTYNNIINIEIILKTNLECL